VSKGSRNRQTARERAAQMRAEQARRQRRRVWIGVAAGGVAVIAAAVAIPLAVASSGGPKPSGSTPAALSSPGALKPAPAAGALGPEGVPVPAAPPLAGVSASTTGQPIDGISCQTSEQTLFHIHAHLVIFVNGKQRQVPAAIGIPGARAQSSASGPFIGTGTCFYWLHTHAASGARPSALTRLARRSATLPLSTTGRHSEATHGTFRSPRTPKSSWR
jgi:hypothetical protein